jgi:aubergine-like protein
MKELAAITRQNPARRQLEVKKFVKTIRENPEALAHLTVWGIELDDRPVAVQGRVLPPERLLFGKK